MRLPQVSLCPSSTIIIFFTLYLTDAKAPQWFGNVNILETLDQNGGAVKKVVEEGQKFGPSTWP